MIDINERDIAKQFARLTGAKNVAISLRNTDVPEKLVLEGWANGLTSLISFNETCLEASIDDFCWDVLYEFASRFNVPDQCRPEQHPERDSMPIINRYSIVYYIAP